MSDDTLTWRQQTNARLAVLEEGLRVNTELTKKVEQNTQELVDGWGALKGGFKVLEVLGKIAKPISLITAAMAAGIAFVGSFKGWWTR